MDRVKVDGTGENAAHDGRIDRRTKYVVRIMELVLLSKAIDYDCICVEFISIIVIKLNEL